MQLLQRGEEEGVVSQQMAERNVVEKAAAKEASSESGDAASLVPADEIEVRNTLPFATFQAHVRTYVCTKRTRYLWRAQINCLPCHGPIALVSFFDPAAHRASARPTCFVVRCASRGSLRSRLRS